MELYFSTGGYKNFSSVDAVKQLNNIGIKKIELSGTLFLRDNIQKLKELVHINNFQVHNYFPPPENPFVLNLASFDDDIFQKSYSHIINSLEVCKKLNSKNYSFHAGFLCDIKTSEIGKKILKKKLQNRNDSLELFIERVTKISEIAKKYEINLMIENNVLSRNNFLNFETNPFLMCDFEECEKVINETSSNVKLLVDLAHLKVSSNTMGFDKYEFLKKCNDYIGAYHLSDNDGLSDTNQIYHDDSWFWGHLKKDVNYYSIEVYNLKNNEIFELYNYTKNKLLAL